MQQPAQEYGTWKYFDSWMEWVLLISFHPFTLAGVAFRIGIQLLPASWSTTKESCGNLYSVSEEQMERRFSKDLLSILRRKPSLMVLRKLWRCQDSNKKVMEALRFWRWTMKSSNSKMEWDGVTCFLGFGPLGCQYVMKWTDSSARLWSQKKWMWWLSRPLFHVLLGSFCFVPKRHFHSSNSLLLFQGGTFLCR